MIRFIRQRRFDYDVPRAPATSVSSCVNDETIHCNGEFFFFFFLIRERISKLKVSSPGLEVHDSDGSNIGKEWKERRETVHNPRGSRKCHDAGGETCSLDHRTAYREDQRQSNTHGKITSLLFSFRPSLWHHTRCLYTSFIFFSPPFFFPLFFLYLYIYI